jgi:hypothetical protein
VGDPAGAELGASGGALATCATRGARHPCIAYYPKSGEARTLSRFPAAQAEGKFSEEIVAIEVHGRKGPTPL